MKKKLLFVITQFYIGGAENTLLNLFRQLSPLNYDIDFLLLNQNDNKRPTNLKPHIPDHINVIDYIEKTNEHVWVGGEQQTKTAEAIIAEHYDFAFHIGEWWSPEFVATYVRAHCKGIWLHNDLNLIQNIAKNEIELFSHIFSHFIFVSDGSMLNSFKLFPFMKRNSVVIHNLIDIAEVGEKANESLSQEDEALFDNGLPVFLTVANLRPEKRHLRCLEAMRLLKERGIEFVWLNVGTKSDAAVTEQLEREIAEYGLEGRYILLGPRENPYPLIKRADAITVCSHVESWSLVITEALSLGVPVVATPTSGALEQLSDGDNGIITSGFESGDIADGISRFLEMRKHMKGSTTYDFSRGVNDFLTLVENAKPRRTILYMIDDINYVGGLHKATFAQIKHLMPYYDITFLSRTEPHEDLWKNELAGVQVVTFDRYEYKSYLHLSTKDVLKGDFPIKQKMLRSFVYILKLVRLNKRLTKKLTMKNSNKMEVFLESFDNVVSLSESAGSRELVANLKKPKKIQWIHQNYKCFYNWNQWTREITANDAELYRQFDAIVNLSGICRDDFIDVYPHLAEKALAIRNFAPGITPEKYETNAKLVNPEYFNIITIARLDDQKNVYGYLTIARLLKHAGVKFHWYIVGDGPLKTSFESCFALYEVNDCIIATGNVKKPYPLLKQCDLFVLFSFCEGTPVTIEEAQLLQIPVIARKVGGIPDMINDGVTGWLVDGDETDCFMKIIEVINNPEQLHNMRKNLANRNPHDEEVLVQLRELFG